MIFEIIISLLEGVIAFILEQEPLLAKVFPSSHPAAKQALLQVMEA